MEADDVDHGMDGRDERDLAAELAERRDGAGRTLGDAAFALEHERDLGQRFLDGLPGLWRLHGARTTDGRVPTFALTSETLSPQEAATRLGERGLAVWDGNYYAVEIMERLGLADGAVRVGIVHYNTADEVDRLLAALDEIVV